MQHVLINQFIDIFFSVNEQFVKLIIDAYLYSYGTIMHRGRVTQRVSVTFVPCTNVFINEYSLPIHVNWFMICYDIFEISFLSFMVICFMSGIYSAARIIYQSLQTRIKWIMTLV